MSNYSHAADEASTKLLKALGIQDQGVIAVNIKLRSGKFAQVTILRYLRQNDLEEFAEQVQQYELRPKVT